MSTSNRSIDPADFTTATLDVTAATSWERFDRTTSRWGRITMIAALILMVGGPAVLAMQLGVQASVVATGVLAIAVAFGVVWVVEPFAYFPILGPASMYQAFMIGNISNKLLPSAIVAQSTIGAKPETKRGQLAAVLAICGAAAVHLLSLLIFVGFLGTILLRIIPPDVMAAVQTFILPAVMGAVVVQMLASNPQPRIIAIAVGVGVVVQLVLTPLVPAIALFSIAISVVMTILLALFLPGGKKKPVVAEPELEDIS